MLKDFACEGKHIEPYLEELFPWKVKYGILATVKCKMANSVVNKGLKDN
jgi:hypothetical protein